MASNFRIIRHRNSDSLHLKLMGNFDGSSAYELIHVLESNNGNPGKIFIHTCSLTGIHPFGLDIIQNNSTLKKLSRRLTFTGEYGCQIALEGSTVL